MAERYSVLYIATRFKNKLSSQPYALNLTKLYTPLTFVQCESRQRQEQLSTIASDHHKFLNMLDLSSFCSVSNRHLPLSLKLNHVHHGTTRTKNIKDLFVYAESEIRPKSVLVEGAPGIGKTELVKEIAYCWAERKILCDIKIVFVLYLRDPKVHEVNSLKTLVDFMNKDLIDDDTAESVIKQLRESQGDHVLFLMDGFDECHDKLEEDCFVTSLLDRSVLSKSLLLITSQPSGYNQVGHTAYTIRLTAPLKSMVLMRTVNIFQFHIH